MADKNTFNPTPLEKQFAELAFPNIPLDSNKLSTIREIMLRTAYHEAGHLAAAAFCAIAPPPVEYIITIIPNEFYNGQVMYRHNISEAVFHTTPKPLRRTRGTLILIELLGGRAAQNKVASPEDRIELLDEEDDEWITEGTDLFRAARIADLMQTDDKTADEFLTEAAEMTKEIIEIPDVWGLVEKLAKRLLKEGHIDDVDYLDEMVASIDYWVARKDWNKRLSPTEE